MRRPPLPGSGNGGTQAEPAIRSYGASQASRGLCPGTSTGQFRGPVSQNLAATGRAALNCSLSDNLIDCAKPSEDFVLKSALRP
jgi:hypothetical protein